MFDFGKNPRFTRERESRAHLDSMRTGRAGFGELFGRGIAPRQPERSPDVGDDLEIGKITLPVSGRSVRIGPSHAARRRVVTPGGVMFYHEPVHIARRALHHRLCQRVGRDDRQEVGARQLGQLTGEILPRVEPLDVAVPTGVLLDAEVKLHGFPVGERIQHAGDGHRNPGADQNDLHASQHRAQNRGHVRELDFLEVVDPHRTGVSLFGQEHLYEVRHNQEFQQRGPQSHPGKRSQLEGLVRRFSARNKKGVEAPLSHVGPGELGQRPADCAAGIAQLQAAHQHRVQCGSGYHAELSVPCYHVGQTPIGYCDPHSALNDPGQVLYWCYVIYQGTLVG